MIATLAASWGIVIRRARADWLILAAAALTILLATTLLAAGPIYTDAVTLSGLRRVIRSAPAAEGNIAVAATVAGRSYATTDRAVTARLREAVAPIGATIWRRGRSESFALPGQDPAAVRDLAVFAFIEGIEGRATLTAGAWPAGAGEPFEVALPATVAEARGYRLGEELRLQSRLTPAFQPRIRIVGLYQINDPADPYWYGDPLETTGREEGQSFTTWGPFVVPPALLLGPLNPTAARITWRAYPNFERLTADDLPRLRGAVLALPGALGPAATGATVETRLPAHLEAAERSLLVTRSGVLIQLLQLALLAGYALVLTVGLLVEGRRVEAMTFHSRGAGHGQVLAIAIVEGILLAVPAAIAGPPLAAFALRLLNRVGPLAPLGLGLAPRAGRDAWAIAGATALACVVLLALPALGAARAIASTRAGRARQAAQGMAQRAGIDLALLVVAVLAYTQLRRYGAPLTRTVQGRLGIDPLLVAAPGLGLLAGATIALRLLPLLARLAEAVATGGRSATAALGAWQVARRPQRYARAALLLILALGIGLFAVAYARTWSQSQGDQADYQVGADLRVEPDRRTGTSIPAYQLAATYRALPGVAAAMPVLKSREEFTRATGTGDLILLDSRQAARIVPFRPDLADEPLAALLERLARGRQPLAGLPIPGEPHRLAIDLRATRAAPIPANGGTSFFVALVIQDADGIVYRLPGGRLRGDGSVERLVAPLGGPLPGGPVARSAYPLTLVSIEIGAAVSRVEERAGIDLVGLRVSDAATGEGWGDVPPGPAAGGWTLAGSELSVVTRAPTIEAAPVAPGALLSARISTGQTNLATVYPITFGLRPGEVPAAAPVPVIVDERLLARTRARVGDTIEISLAGASRRVEIVGAARGFPTLEPGESPFIVADFPTVAARSTGPAATITDPTTWWLATEPGRAAPLAETLRRAPFSSPRVLSRDEGAALLRSNPLALGTIGALALGFVAAALVAVLGFAVNAAASARERLAEFALLRALGLHPRQFVAWLSLEQGITIALSLLGGVGLGVLLARTVLPIVALTQAGTAAMPPVQVVIPWGTVGLLAGGLLVGLVGAAAALASLLRRVGLAAVLRTGGE